MRDRRLPERYETDRGGRARNRGTLDGQHAMVGRAACASWDPEWWADDRIMRATAVEICLETQVREPCGDDGLSASGWGVVRAGLLLIRHRGRIQSVSLVCAHGRQKPVRMTATSQNSTVDSDARNAVQSHHHSRPDGDQHVGNSHRGYPTNRRRRLPGRDGGHGPERAPSCEYAHAELDPLVTRACRGHRPGRRADNIVGTRR